MFWIYAFGLVGCTDKASSEENSIPTVRLLSPEENAVFFEGQEVLLEVMVEDANDPVESLSVTFSSQDRVLCEAQSPDAEGVVSCAQILNFGEGQISVEAIDPQGDAGTLEFLIVVQNNNAPSVQLVLPQGNGDYFADEPIEFTAILNDLEDDNQTLQYVWESSIDGVLPATAVPNGQGLLEDSMFLTEGSHALSITVSDQYGKTGTASTNVVVQPANQAPACQILSPSEGEVYLHGDVIMFLASATDDADENLSIRWMSDLDGDLGTGNMTPDGEYRLNATALSVGTHIITFEAEDSKGKFCSETRTVSLGTPPVLTLESPNYGDIVPALSPISFSGMVTDAEDAPTDILFSWESDRDGVFSAQGATADGQFLMESHLSQGSHMITLVATDPLGLQDSLSFAVRVNTPPSISGVSISAAQPLNGDTVSCMGIASDADNDPLSESYTWTYSGTGSVLGSSSMLTLSASQTQPGDTVTCTYEVFDGYDTVSMSSAVVVGNAPPSISSLSIIPSTPGFGETLECAGVIIEPDGEGYTESYVWMNQNTGMTLGSSSTLTLSSSMASLGDELQCTLTVTDTTGGTVSESVTATVSGPNTPPQITNFQLSSTTVYTNETLSASVNVSDVDGDLLFFDYSWSVDGVLVQSGSSNSLSGSYFEKGDDIILTLTIDDGVDSVSQSATATCLNSVPTATGISLSPLLPIAGQDDLFCQVDTPATDADGDALTYSFSWSVDGIPYVNATSTSMSSTIPASELQSGEEWVCSVWADDGQDVGPVSSELVVVEPDVYTSCFDLYQFDSSASDGVYSIDIDGTGIEVDVYCDMGNGGITYEDFGFGQYNQSYTDWEVLNYTEFYNQAVAEALVYHFNLNGLVNISPGWNSSNCCYISPGTSNYYSFNGGQYMYPAESSSSYNCNGTYNASTYYFYTNNPSGYLTTLTTSQVQNIGTYSSCTTSGNPAIFVKRWQ